jgi:hypothetical protein
MITNCVDTMKVKTAYPVNYIQMMVHDLEGSLPNNVAQPLYNDTPLINIPETMEMNFTNYTDTDKLLGVHIKTLANTLKNRPTQYREPPSSNPFDRFQGLAWEYVTIMIFTLCWLVLLTIYAAFMHIKYRKLASIILLTNQLAKAKAAIVGPTLSTTPNGFTIPPMPTADPAQNLQLMLLLATLLIVVLTALLITFLLNTVRKYMQKPKKTLHNCTMIPSLVMLNPYMSVSLHLPTVPLPMHMAYVILCPIPDNLTTSQHRITGLSVFAKWSGQLKIRCYRNTFVIKMPSHITVPRHLIQNVTSIFMERNRVLTIFFLRLDSTCQCSAADVHISSNASSPLLRMSAAPTPYAAPQPTQPPPASPDPSGTSESPHATRIRMLASRGVTERAFNRPGSGQPTLALQVSGRMARSLEWSC